MTLGSQYSATSLDSLLESEELNNTVHKNNDSFMEGDDSNDEDIKLSVVKHEEHDNVVYTGLTKRVPVLIFSQNAINGQDASLRYVGEKYRLCFKTGNTDCKLVKSILRSHGFHECTNGNSTDYNLQWTGCHLKPNVLRSMQDFQKINHFPRSYEMTRKDRLYKNLQRMQQLKGVKQFDFVPVSFVLPNEFHDFCQHFVKDRGIYIVKPVASSRGRGIFLVSHPDQVPLDENLVICKYLDKPFLINDLKFDIRLYVAVTSYDPLIIYLYEEGLTRFATVKYSDNFKFMNSNCMHLTNYSVNKKSSAFVRNDNADVEDYGSKWSLGALLRYLRLKGIDTVALMLRLEDVIIKTVMSIESHVATACKMFQPHRGNCFELYGFDILLDEDLRPWVLEVNLSPSLACDAPIDFKIKSHMLSDLFSLVGLACQDPTMHSAPSYSSTDSRVGSASSGRTSYSNNFMAMTSAGVNLHSGVSRPGSSSGRPPMAPKSSTKTIHCENVLPLSLTNEELRVIRRTREENERRGGWVRIMPRKDTWYLYGSLFQTQTSFNLILHQRLFPKMWKLTPSSNKIPIHNMSPKMWATISDNSSDVSLQLKNVYLWCAREREQFYERMLGTVPKRVDSSFVKAMSNSERGAYANLTDEAKVVPSYAASKLNLKKATTTTHESIQESTKSTHSIKEEHAKAIINTKEKSTTLAEVSAEERPPHCITFDLVQIIERGGEMTKVQARHTFSAYLSRVQQRLLAESNCSAQDSDEQTKRSVNEQIDLVLRFLRRAAKSLQQPFKLVIPSRKLPYRLRQSILAKLLSDFVELYSKETERILCKPRNHQKMISKSDSATKDFNAFLRHATEAELEQVLTVYTNVKKSAGIFMRSTSDESNINDNSEDLVAHPVSISKASKDEAGQASSLSVSSSAAVSQNDSIGAYLKAAYLKSKVTTPSDSRQRPASATSSVGENDARFASSSNNVRPTSASGLRSSEKKESIAQVHDKNSIDEALQKLTFRQQSRQYSGYRLENEWQSTNLVDMYNSLKQDRPRIDLHLSNLATSRGAVTNTLTAVWEPTSAADVRLVKAQRSLMQQIKHSRALLQASRDKHDALLAQAQSSTDSHVRKKYSLA